ncbi:ribosome maturation factor RimP [Parasulfuritortus cantonensis]|uniref:Ribosome maturation factor RimP n=1 Tax=Parasulfuritortus cantonensis TaxID=2528202 RepID=A0A4R1BL95_9PROT|nr:ribosome maturation factor RimP [Parasulfuritortus cantonensis]TCJ18190.1 ribosome maturation factor RimP [Parasulfuritortus cantonensis]
MELQNLIEPTLVGMGYELVATERVGRGLLRVYIDKPDGIGVEDCVKVSNQLTRLFMVENVDYSRLEVSSPGLDRPLVKEADFVRFAGEAATIKLRMPTEAGRKKFVGKLAGVTDGVLHLETETGAEAIPLADIDSARLVPNI